MENARSAEGKHREESSQTCVRAEGVNQAHFAHLHLLEGTGWLLATRLRTKPSFIRQRQCRMDHRVFKTGKSPSKGKCKGVAVGESSDPF